MHLQHNGKIKQIVSSAASVIPTQAPQAPTSWYKPQAMWHNSCHFVFPRNPSDWVGVPQNTGKNSSPKSQIISGETGASGWARNATKLKADHPESLMPPLGGAGIDCPRPGWTCTKFSQNPTEY